MPEGDSVAGHAEMLRPLLVGHRLTGVGGTAPAVRVNSNRLLGSKVESIRTRGKNLLIDLDSGYSIRVHLGMPGRWQLLRGEQRAHGSARLVLQTELGSAACYSAPTVEVDRTPAIEAHLAPLGPDVLDEFDPNLFLTRARTQGDRAVQAVLLDQRVLAGIGNVYKSELLFLEAIHPDTPVAMISDEKLHSMGARAATLVAANVGRGRRSTTGERGRGREMFVYGREGRPCRRCRTAIVMARNGDRLTYWCPDCQRPPDPERLGIDPVAQ